jgi:hypothetical protein
MEQRELQVGDVVQIDPTKEGCFFRGALMIVTEPKSWGAQGYFPAEFTREEMPKRAYYRASWAEMEYVGSAVWIPADEGVETHHES